MDLEERNIQAAKSIKTLIQRMFEAPDPQDVLRKTFIAAYNFWRDETSLRLPALYWDLELEYAAYFDLPLSRAVGSRPNEQNGHLVSRERLNQFIEDLERVPPSTVERAQRMVFDAMDVHFDRGSLENPAEPTHGDSSHIPSSEPQMTTPRRAPTPYAIQTPEDQGAPSRQPTFNGSLNSGSPPQKEPAGSEPPVKRVYYDSARWGPLPNWGDEEARKHGIPGDAEAGKSARRCKRCPKHEAKCAEMEAEINGARRIMEVDINRMRREREIEVNGWRTRENHLLLCLARCEQERDELREVVGLPPRRSILDME